MTAIAHRISVMPVGLGQRGPIYRVVYQGETLTAATRVPLLDACRTLLARGIRGRLELWRPGKAHWDAAVDIERGAQLTVRETERHGPRFAPWQPAPEIASQDAVSRYRGTPKTAIASAAGRVVPPTPGTRRRPSPEAGRNLEMVTQHER